MRSRCARLGSGGRCSRMRGGAWDALHFRFRRSLGCFGSFRSRFSFRKTLQYEANFFCDFQWD